MNEDRNNHNLDILIREVSETYVLDASVCIKWFSPKDEEYVEKASEIRAKHKDNKISIAAPDLLVYEITNALSYNPLFDSEKVNKAVRSLYQMDIKFIKPSITLMEEAINLRFLKEITIYDAIYIALAKHINVQCITADRKLFHSINGVSSVIFLGDYRTG